MAHTILQVIKEFQLENKITDIELVKIKVLVDKLMWYQTLMKGTTMITEIRLFKTLVC
jgi:hypothetical protein